MATELAFALLSRQGINLVRRPEVHLAPLDLLGRDDVLDHLGPLPALFTSSVPVPTRVGPDRAPDYSGQQTELIEIEVADRILVRLLRCLGHFVERVALGARPEDVRFLRFSFDDVETLSVSPQDVAAYLFAAQPAPGPVRDRYIDNPEADAYVVTQVLQSRSIRVLPLDAGGEAVPVGLPSLAQTAGETPAAAIDGDWIRFSGTGAATMAFACYRVALTGGTWGIEGDASQPILIAPGMRVLVSPGPVALVS